MTVKRFSSIQFKIIALILFLLLAAGIFIVSFINGNQRANLITAMDRGIYLNTETLMTALNNMMLDGRAPLLVKSISDLKDLGEYKTIAIYRTNGTPAFSDYQTLDYVNSHQKSVFFEKTPRLPHQLTPAEKNATLNRINESLDKASLVKELYNQTKELEYFYPIENQADCMKCHGSASPYRGVIDFKLSIAGTYKQIDRTRNQLVTFFLFVGLALIVILILFLGYLIISPIRRIGTAVEQLGNGDFKARVNLNRKDELGSLAEQINMMIKGLEERFKLSKYVSSSTRSMVASEGESEVQTSRKTITVLFSDVRGFTSFTESHPPEEVIGTLNRILEIQAETVEKYGGDIDKFVGDEIMAVFTDPSAALRSADEMIRKVLQLDLNLEVGIGINTGEVLAGNIGSQTRREYAVIGDTVNLASRLCSLAKPSTILITEPVYSAVKEEITAELQSGQSIKGKKNLIDVYLVKSFNFKD